MTGKTHAGIAAVTYVALCVNLPDKFNYVAMGIVILSSLLPDIDHPKSIINKYILPFKNKWTKFTVYACLGIIVLYFDYIYMNEPAFKALGFSLILIAISSHRTGITHSLTGMIVFTFIVGYISKMYNLPYITNYFIIGYGMHLLCDMATNRGISLFYPFKNKNIKLPLTFRTGSKFGNFVEEFIMILGLIYIVYKLPGILR